MIFVVLLHCTWHHVVLGVRRGCGLNERPVCDRIEQVVFVTTVNGDEKKKSYKKQRCEQKKKKKRMKKGLHAGTPKHDVRLLMSYFHATVYIATVRSDF